MVVARYAPVVFPQPLNVLRGGDYQNYFPRFNGQGETTAEEHWEAFLSYADNQNIEAKDVWMRMFVQSLDKDVRTQGAACKFYHHHRRASGPLHETMG